MKKLIISLSLFLILGTPIFSQWTIIVKLVQSNGITPLTGQSSNIEFLKYPYSYPSDIVAGITVTESGVTGTYKCKGFTTWQPVKLYLSGVEYTAFDSTQSGNIQTWLPSNYVTLGTSQTIIGSKGTTGQWVNTNTWYFYDARIHTSSSYYPYGLSDGRQFVPKVYGDSLYGEKKWWINGFKVRLLTGYKLYGVNSSTSPILIDASDLTYADETLGLTVGSTQDSTQFHEAVGIYYDSTDGLETNFRKVFTDYMPSYKHSGWDSIGTKTKYERITGGSVISQAEYYNTNNAYSKELEVLTGLSTTDAIIDTLILPRPGLYQVTSVFTAHFVDNIGASTDSIVCSIDDGSVGGASRLAKSVVTHTYDGTANSGQTMTVTVTCLFTATSPGQVLYLMAKNNQATSSLIHEIWKTQSTWISIH